MNQQAYDEDLGADLAGVSTDEHYSTLPAGLYQAQAVQIEVKASKTGGRYVAAQFEILQPGFEGRRVFENFNIMNNNPQTVEIALKSIKQWVMACGGTGEERLTLGLLKGLEGKEFIADIKVEVDKTGQYGDKNRVKRFIAADTQPSAAPAKPTATAAQYAAAKGAPAARNPAAAAGKRPWER